MKQEIFEAIENELYKSELPTIATNQLMHVRYLITEFFQDASNFWLDDAEERVYFFNNHNESEMQARIDRDNEVVRFEILIGDDWYFADSATFEEMNEINESPIF